MLLAASVALGYSVGVDDPSMSDAAILERLNDDARQVAAGVGMPVLAAGIALLLWFATGLRRVLDRLSGGDVLGVVHLRGAKVQEPHFGQGRIRLGRASGNVASNSAPASRPKRQ